MAAGPEQPVGEPPLLRSHAPHSEAKRACVLVAEDEDRLRELTVDMLLDHGFDAMAARHGGEALSLFTQHAEHIDAVLLDLSMPVMDGTHVFSEMRRHKPSVRVVLTSGFDDDAGVTSSAEDRVLFLQKPYRAESLLARLRAVLSDN